MNIPVITKGATTDHGGTVVECFETFTIDGKKVHLDGMKHFCPKCNKEVFAIASNHTKTMMGKAWVLEGDKASCGATFIANQGLGFVGDGGRSSNTSSELVSNLAESTDNKEIYDEQIQFIFEGESDEIVSLINYRLKVGNKVYEGKLDSEGKTPRFVTDKPEKITDIELFFSNVKSFSDYELGE